MWANGGKIGVECNEGCYDVVCGRCGVWYVWCDDAVVYGISGA